MLKTKYIILFFGLLICKYLCDFAYENVVSVLFAYQHFENDPTTNSMLISWGIFFILSPLILKTNFEENLSSSIVKILIFVSFFPTCTMIAYHSSYELEYIILISAYWAILLISNLYIPKIIIGKKRFLKNNYILEIITIVLCVNIFFISWKFAGFRLQLDLMQVYDIRAEARGYIPPSKLNAYLSTFADNLLPIILVYFLHIKKNIFALLIGLIIFLNFGISGTKQVILLLMFALIGFYIFKTLKVSNYFIWGFNGLLLIGLAEFVILKTWFLTVLSTYRVFFIPAKLHYVYYNFFSQNELDYFRQSFLKIFFESPYKENIGFLMGYEDIGDFGARANNGLFTDAYYNFGMIGVFIFPIIVVVILKILDGSVSGLSEKFLFIITVSTSFVLLGLPFSTALFSAGIIPLVFLLYTIPRNKLSNVSKN